MRTEDTFCGCVSKLPDGCWEWRKCKNAKGYGVLRWGSTNKLAHRLSFELQRGGIQNGFELDHLCKNHACVNPDHLEAVSHAENIRRGNSGKHNLIKTHCPAGHPYVSEHLRMYEERRYCRTCHAEYTLASYDRKGKRV